LGVLLFVLDYLGGFASYEFFVYSVIFWGVIILMIGITELIIYGLKRKSFYAWVGGIMLSGLYIPSLYLPLGVLALVGLLNENVRSEFLHKEKTV
jgi:hypothetical protein